MSLPWGPMARMAGRRTLLAAPVLLAVTFGVFAVAALSPFDPVKAYAGTAGLTASQAELDRLRANLGVDRALVPRWWDWLTSAVTGDLGTSSVMRQPVADVIGERVGLGADLLARRPHEVSDGQLQRACLARALVLRPRWLVCDEMTAMLDASTAAALVAVVEEYRAESGAGLLAVGHDPVLLGRWCGRTTHWSEIVKD
ncbi:ATP-binding cassette domain-containing protein [Streptomyces sp. NBC_01233]|uniref:ATP-binding cassette domain-containing protein n=1 Tax=Streptomyces sp. NBC_01233 TaxID=2903787 RepID=UPI003FA3877B|nr:ATP-binding cassette domain-containing protein [Streptomyces sp. NBC_01233]